MSQVAASANHLKPAVPRLWAGGIELAARRIVDGLRAGRHRSPSLGPAAEFHDHRPYQQGDDLRRVDWRAFARCDRLLLRRTREERDLPLVLVLDLSASMAYGEPEKDAWARLAAASLAMLAGDQGDRIRLAAGAGMPTVWTDEGAGPGGALRLCAALATCTCAGAGAVDQLLDAAVARLRRRSLVVLLSDLLGDPAALSRSAGQLAGRGHELAVLHVHDASEAELPAAWAQCQLTDPEHPDSTRAVDAPAAQAGYALAWRGHVRALQMGLLATRAELVSACTRDDVAQVIGGWLRRRAQR